MRNKILMIAAMLAVMVAMTGIATALPYDAELMNAAGTMAASKPLNLTPGTSITLSYKAYNIDPSALAANGGAGEIIPYYNYTELLGGGALAGDITITTPATLQLSAEPTIDVGAITITIAPGAAIGAKYRVNIGAGSRQGEMPVTIEKGEASRVINSVPEFPTVALPIAAVIGLVFFFQNKKKKE